MVAHRCTNPLTIHMRIPIRMITVHPLPHPSTAGPSCHRAHLPPYANIARMVAACASGERVRQWQECPRVPLFGGCSGNCTIETRRVVGLTWRGGIVVGWWWRGGIFVRNSGARQIPRQIPPRRCGLGFTRLSSRNNIIEYTYPPPTSQRIHGVTQRRLYRRNAHPVVVILN
jgi:hypothetical protein